MWLRDSNLESLIEKLWKEVNLKEHTHMFQLNSNLKYIKMKLKEWNKNQFKNIFQEKREWKKIQRILM